MLTKRTERKSKEQFLIDEMEEIGASLPWQLKNWQRYFLNEDNYLAAFEGWLKKQKITKGWVKIEDDVDKKLMKIQPNPHSEYSEDDDYWLQGMGAQSQSTSYYSSGLYVSSRTLPLTPTIAAPFGLSVSEDMAHAIM